jgi:hypothetical protein
MTIACTSPRTTNLLHERRDLLRLGQVVRIRNESSSLGRQPSAAPLTRRRLCDRLPGSLGTGHAPPPCKLIERAHTLLAES